MPLFIKKMRKNIGISIALNYTLIVISSLCSLIMVPVFRNGLGDEIYGVYLLALSIITLFAVSDYHIGTAFINEIIRLHTIGKKEELGGYIRKMFAAYLLLASVMTFICFGFAEIYPVFFRENIIHIDLFRSILRLMSVNCFLLFFQNYLFGIITGFGLLPFTRICNILKVVIRTMILIFLMNNNYSPVSAALLDIFITLSVIIAYIFYILPLKINFSSTFMKRDILKKNLPNMLILYIMPMLNSLYWVSCVQIIGRRISPEAVVEFNIAMVFCQLFTQLAATLSHIQMGAAAELKSLGNDEEFREYITSRGITLGIFLGFILISFASIGKLFLDLWLGIGAFQEAYRITLIMMGAMFLPLAHSMLEIELYIKNGYFLRTINIGIMATINFAAVWLLMPLGLIGAAIASGITMLLFGFLLMNIFYKHMHIPAWSFTLKICWKILPSLLISLGGAMLIKTINLQNLAVELIISLFPPALFLTSAYFFALNTLQRQMIKEKISKIILLPKTKNRENN